VVQSRCQPGLVEKHLDVRPVVGIAQALDHRELVEADRPGATERKTSAIPPLPSRAKGTYLPMAAGKALSRLPADAGSTSMAPRLPLLFKAIDGIARPYRASSVPRASRVRYWRL
jgi:hypothetical protein